MRTTPDRLAAALVDRYTPQDPLGSGGMATVYRARDLRHGRDVALNVLRPDVGEALGRDRFFLGISHQAGGKADPRAALEWLALDPLSPLANGLVSTNSWWTGRFADGTTNLDALLGRLDDAAVQARCSTDTITFTSRSPMPWRAHTPRRSRSSIGRSPMRPRSRR